MTTNTQSSPFPGVSQEQFEELVRRAVIKHLLARDVASAIEDDIDRYLVPELQALVEHLAVPPLPELASSHVRARTRPKFRPFGTGVYRFLGL